MPPKLSELGAHGDMRPAKSNELNAVEQRLGSRLPASYRRFLATSRGPIEFDSDAEFDVAGDTTQIVCFFGLQAEQKEYDLEHNASVYEDCTAKDLLPIAELSGGDLLCVRLLAPKSGFVVFWDHEEDETTDLAPSIEKFLELVRSKSTESETDLTDVEVSLDPDLLATLKR